jgi:MarR family 2-MHQ and catechol resistance regulon transcriptional repressor
MIKRQSFLLRGIFVAKGYKGMAADARALAAYVKLLRAGEDISREATRPLALYNLTPSQFGVLEALYNAGPQSLTDLARRILKTSGNLTVVVENLEKRRLVRRKPGSRDRRVITVALTPKGRALVGSLSPGHAAAIVGIMARLSAAEQEALGKLCAKLSAANGAPNRR